MQVSFIVGVETCIIGFQMVDDGEIVLTIKEDRSMSLFGVD